MLICNYMTYITEVIKKLTIFQREDTLVAIIKYIIVAILYS